MNPASKPSLPAAGKDSHPELPTPALRAAGDHDQLYREIVETAQEGIWVLNDHGDTTFVNQRLASLLGYSVEEMIGQPLCRFFDGPGPDPGERIERHLLRKDGSSFWAIIDSRRIISRNGEYRGMRASVVDMTENHVAQEQLQLRESQLLDAHEEVSSLGRLAAAVVHEFDLLLAGLQPFVDIVTRSAHEPQLRSAAAHIVDGLARGKRITHDVLKFTRIPEPALRPVNVATWLRDLESELAHLAGARVIVRLEAASDLRVIADAHQLREVFWNITANARDAMPHGGTLNITAWRESQVVHFTLRDTGAGIGPDQLPHIFDPLFTKRKPGATGLGLASAQQIVLRHHGEIYAESTLGVGTTIHVVIPAADG